MHGHSRVDVDPCHLLAFPPGEMLPRNHGCLTGSVRSASVAVHALTARSRFNARILCSTLVMESLFFRKITFDISCHNIGSKPMK